MKKLSTHSLSKAIAPKAMLGLFILICFANPVYCQAPSISYASQHALIVGNSVSISPSSSETIVSDGIQVSTFAGSTAGNELGTCLAAKFASPSGLAFDRSGNLYVSDTANHQIKVITAFKNILTTSCSVSLYAGTTRGCKEGDATKDARFNHSFGLTIDASDNMYVADYGNHSIRKITPKGVVSTFAGSGSPGYADRVGEEAAFYRPMGVLMDAFDNVYVVEHYNHHIRKITPDASTTTLAGRGNAKYVDGIGTIAEFNFPAAIVMDVNQNIYVADQRNHRIRMVTPNGEVTTYAGDGTQAFVDGPKLNASFNFPSGLAIDGEGNLYVADQGNNAIRKISTSGQVTTVAGTGSPDYLDDSGKNAKFNSPVGIAINDCGDIYVADMGNSVIRKITEYGYRISPALPAGLSIDTSTGIIGGKPTEVTPLTTYIVTATNSSGCNSTTINLKTTLPCTPPRFEYPNNSSVEKSMLMTPIVPITAGGDIANSGTETSTLANLSFISVKTRVAHGMIMDSQKNIYITHQNTNKILQITPSGIVSTFAGNGTTGSANGPKGSAQFNVPTSLAIDKDGNIYVADYVNTKIRKIATDGNVSYFPSATALPHTPEALAFDNDNNLYFAGAGQLSYINTTNSSITNIVPSGLPSAIAAIVVDSKKNVYTAESDKTTILKISSTGIVTTYAGSTVGNQNGALLDAKFKSIYNISADPGGNIYVADRGNGIRKISGNIVSTVVAEPNTLACIANQCGVITNWVSSGSLTDRIVSIVPLGFNISPPLPTGLSIDNITGEISGTPTQTRVNTPYTVTALNDCACNSQTLYLTVTRLPWDSRFIGGYGHGDHESNNLEGSGSGSTNYFDNGGKPPRGSSGNKKWSNPDNWTIGIPLETEDAIIRADAEVDSIFTHANLIIQNGGSVTILASDTVPINQTKAKSCALIIKGSVSGTKVTNVNGEMKYNLRICSGAGKTNGSLIFFNPADKPVVAEVEMYSKAVYPRWQFFGVPVQTVDYDNEFTYSLICGYHVNDIPAHWDWLSGSFRGAQLTAFNSYAIAEGADTYSFKGQLVNNDTIISLDYKAGASYPDNYLIGNSYTAAIDMTKIAFTGTDLKTVYLYNTGSYKEWESYYPGKQIGNSPGQYLSVPQLLAGIPPFPSTIPSMQAFLVLAKNGAKSYLSIPYKAAIANKARYNEIQRTKAETSYSSTIIDIRGEYLSDLVCLFTIPTTTKGYDGGYDGNKILGPETCPQLFAREKCGDYQVNSVDNIDSTLLCFRAGTDQAYTLNFTHYNLGKYYDKLYLQDLVENSITDITPSGTQYKFTDDNPEVHDRFRILTHIDLVTQLVQSSSSNIRLYNTGHILLVDNATDASGVLSIYDITGRTLQNAAFKANGKTEIELNYPTGIYMAKAVNALGTVSKKIRINSTLP